MCRRSTNSSGFHLISERLQGDCGSVSVLRGKLVRSQFSWVRIPPPTPSPSFPRIITQTIKLQPAD